MKTLPHLLAIGMLCLQYFSVKAQSHPSKSDSLVAELAKDLHDTSRVNTLNLLAWELIHVGLFDSAKVYLDQAMPLAQEGFEKYTIKTNHIYGVFHLYQDRAREAIEYWNKALPMAKQINSLKDINSITDGLAGAQYMLGNYPEAIRLHVEALTGCEKLNNKNGAAIVHANMGNTYFMMQDHEKARFHYNTSLEEVRKTNNVQIIVQCLLGLAELSGAEHDFDNGKEYFFQIIELGEKEQQPPLAAIGLSGLGNINMEQGNLSEAIDYFNEAGLIFKTAGDAYSLARDEGRMANLYVKMLDPDKKEALDKHFGGSRAKALDAAQRNIDNSHQFFSQMGDLEALKNIYSIMSSIQELKGDYKSALKSYTQFKMISDSLLNIERDKKITQTAMQYEFDKKEAANKVEQDKKDSRQRTIRNSIAGTLAGSLFFLGVVYRQRDHIKAGKKRSDELLLNILPAEVADELKTRGKTDAKLFDEVTVMFTDFKDFTIISEKLSPADLVQEIHTCFEAFDNIITKHNIEKIKTIGDAYMCAGGLPVTNKTNANDVVEAATEIQQFMAQHKEERIRDGKPIFDIRIGVHTGPVVAGIVGVKKFQYDIWGDTVNLAARMETSGQEGKVNISETTYALVKDNFNCTYRGKIQAKNKGEVDMYFVEEKR